MERMRKAFRKYLLDSLESFRKAREEDSVVVKVVRSKFFPKLVAYYLIEVRGLPKTEVAKVLGVNRVTLYRWLEELKRKEKDLEELLQGRKLPKTVKVGG